MAKRKKKPEGLESFRDRRFFEGWDEFVEAKLVAASEASVRKLVDDLLKLGPNPAEVAARKAVDRCVRRFNRLDDDGWICTIEREDIGEVIWNVVTACGFTPKDHDDWIGERDW